MLLHFPQSKAKKDGQLERQKIYTYTMHAGIAAKPPKHQKGEFRHFALHLVLQIRRSLCGVSHCDNENISAYLISYGTAEMFNNVAIFNLLARSIAH